MLGWTETAGDDPPGVGLLISLEVLVEPLPVVLLNAVDANRPEQAQVLVEQAKLDRGVAHRRLGRLAGVAVQLPRGQPDQETQRAQEDRQQGRDQNREHQQTRRKDISPRHDVEIGDHTVADVVDLARPEVDHRPDSLGRQRRLAQPVHLAVDLAAECR